MIASARMRQTGAAPVGETLRRRQGRHRQLVRERLRALLRGTHRRLSGVMLGIASSTSRDAVAGLMPGCREYTVRLSAMRATIAGVTPSTRASSPTVSNGAFAGLYVLPAAR